jgi:hypothetical protein
MKTSESRSIACLTFLSHINVGGDTIASNPALRFDPTKKFGKEAWNLIERIEECRATPEQWLAISLALSNTRCSWATAARALPSFKVKMSSDDKNKWRAVVKQVLEDDLRDPEKASDYRLLVTAPTHQHRWKTILRQKILDEFDSIWGFHRKSK